MVGKASRTYYITSIMDVQYNIEPPSHLVSLEGIPCNVVTSADSIGNVHRFYGNLVDKDMKPNPDYPVGIHFYSGDDFSMKMGLNPFDLQRFARNGKRIILNGELRRLVLRPVDSAAPISHTIEYELDVHSMTNRRSVASVLNSFELAMDEISSLRMPYIRIMHFHETGRHMEE
jgi:hypothetical protein